MAARVLPAERAVKQDKPKTPKGIGTLNESTLHAQLKALYVQEGAATEAVVEGYVVDVLGPGGEVVEIQTGSLSKLKMKLGSLLAGRRVLLVYPLPVEKRLVLFDARQRRVLSRRVSPRKPRLLEVFQELVAIAPLLAAPGLELEVLLTREEEIRRNDGRGSWRRRGVTIVDRKLLEITERVRLGGPADFLALLPEGCPAEFTNHELAGLLGVKVRTAAQLTYCLRAVGVIEVRGKRGRELLFTRRLAPGGESIV